MTEPIQAPTPQQPIPAQPPVKKPLSVLGIIGLVLGVLALLLSFIPIVNNGSVILGIIGAILALIAVFGTRKNSKHRGMGISVAGLVASVLAVIIALALQASWGAALDKASDDLEKTTDGKTNASSVILEATATSKGNAMWMDMDGSNSSADFSNTWTKELTGDDAKKVWTLSVSNSDYEATDDVKVSCKITVDGKVQVQKEATGQSANASCTMKDN